MSYEDPIVEEYRQLPLKLGLQKPTRLRRSIELSNGKRYTLPRNWYFEGYPQPDPHHENLIKVIHLMEDDEIQSPPWITAFDEGYGYEIKSYMYDVFSNFRIEKNFEPFHGGTEEASDFDPAIRHIICQATAINDYNISKRSNFPSAVKNAQRTLDMCRKRGNLPKVSRLLTKAPIK